MSTPLADAVGRYLAKGRAWLHMPGHKGKAVFPVGEAARFDVTEVQGADSLYQAEGPIAEMERRYARLYGTAASLLSAGGSTLCIQAMLAMVCPPGSRLLCARGVHTAAVNAMALLDLHPQWIWPCPREGDPELGWMNPVTPAQVEEALRACPDACAVYLTSPNYFGILSEIEGIAAVCHKQGVPLLVDGAHGAHLKFLPRSLHPADLGADLCCDSLHKTLPVLTGGALLHICNERYVRGARGRMALFGSTSPSYLIMLSADGALEYLEERVRGDLPGVCRRVDALEKGAANRGFAVPHAPKDPMRLTLGFAAAGFSQEEFGSHVRACGVEPEYLGGRFAVFLAGPRNGDKDFARLRRVIDSAPAGPPIPCAVPEVPGVTQAATLREGVLSPAETVATDRAVGRVCASTVAPCPPGIPLAIPGELLDAALVRMVKNAGVFQVNVLK